MKLNAREQSLGWNRIDTVVHHNMNGQKRKENNHAAMRGT